MTDPPTISKKAFASSGNWTREQLKLAFHFYCQTPFGKLHRLNPAIIELAKLIGRTPDALAMKLVNFASLDPSITANGRSGLRAASRLDREIWEEFNSDWERLVVECNKLHQSLLGEYNIPSITAHIADAASEYKSGDYMGETREAVIQLRLKQQFFRRAVLSGYRSRCCISGVSDARLLVASHIVPWRDDTSIRLHPGNGLCLSAIHDKAFDQYLFSLSDDHRVLLSPALEQTRDDFLREVFHPIADKRIELPERFVPEPAFVQRHRQQMLQGN